MEEHRATEEGLVQWQLCWDRWQAAASRGGWQTGLRPDSQARPGHPAPALTVAVDFLGSTCS